MSGGSYNYLYCKSVADLLNDDSDLEAMVRRIAGLGYARDAARETEELLLLVRQVQVRLGLRAERLSGLWRAVEWWDSCDSGEDSVKAALQQYREQGAL